MIEILFWVSAAVIAYVYAGYPLLLVLWARLRPGAAACDQVRPGAPGAPGALPPISIVLAVRNEAPRLRRRVQNLLEIDYSGERQIIVVSDGSTDHPAAALDTLPYVELVECPPRGKAAALNAGVARARHDLIVFADARQTFARDALQRLVAPFADPAIGGVTGELRLDCEDGAGDGVAEGVGLYWRLEKALRRLESTVGSTLGATGAIYALRRALWQPLPDDTILDDVLAPMRAVLAGYRVVFESRATAFDRASTHAAHEARRKIRTLAGNVQILWLEPRLLVPLVNPVWLQYLSHKVGRLIVPYALVALFAASAALAGTQWIYSLAFIAQCAFYLLALWGAAIADRAGRVAFTFVVLNYSAVAGTIAALTRKKVWR